MQPTTEELNESLNKLMSEPSPPLRPHPREIALEIKTPLAQSLKDAAVQVIEKRNNAAKWKNSQLSSEGVFDRRDGGVGETINGLEINVVQRKDSSLSIEIFDEGYSDATMHENIPNKHFEFTLVDTNSRGEVVRFLPDHSIYERMGLTKDEFAHLVTTRLEGMANKIDLQSSVQQENALISEIPLQEAIQNKTGELVQEVPRTIASDSSTWIESLKSQLDNIDASKLQVFSGNTIVYERINNAVTRDKLKTTTGQKVQQALNNPTELKGIVKVLADGERVYDAQNGELRENKFSLTLTNLRTTQQKSSETTLEVPQVVEAKKQPLQVSQEKSLDFVPETPQSTEIQEQNLQITQETISETVVSKAPQSVENRERNLQVALPEQGQSIVPEKNEVNFIPPPEIVVPVKNEQVKLSTQREQPVSSQSQEKAIFALIAHQDARINQLEQKLAAQTQPLNVKVDRWLGAINQTAKEAVQQVKQKSLHIPQNVRSFIAHKANEIQNSIKEQVKTTRTQVVNKVNEGVTAARTEVIGKVNEVKSSLERKLADVAGTSLNASTRYLAERFGVDNGAGIKVFQGNSLVITSSKEHSGIYAKDGKQLVKDGQFIAPVTKEQLSKIAQVQPEAQKLSQSESAVRAKALR